MSVRPQLFVCTNMPHIRCQSMDHVKVCYMCGEVMSDVIAQGYVLVDMGPTKSHREPSRSHQALPGLEPSSTTQISMAVHRDLELFLRPI